MGRARVGQPQQAAGQRPRTAQQGLAELQDGAEPELAGQQQDVAQLQHVAALEDGAVALDAKALLQHRAGELDVAYAQHHRIAKGGAAGQGVAPDAEIAQALAAAGAQAHVGHGGQALHVAQHRDLLRGGHQGLGVGQLLRHQARALQQLGGGDALAGHFIDQGTQAEQAVGGTLQSAGPDGRGRRGEPCHREPRCILIRALYSWPRTPR